MMNSAYGRTILKQTPYKKVYKPLRSDEDKAAFKRFLNENYYCLKPEMIKIGHFVKMCKRELADNPSGYPHIGSYILEMSKRLMNKMFYKIYNAQANSFSVTQKMDAHQLNSISENKKLSVYYTDTDSIHVQAKSLQYVGDMIGEDMTKFHSDFSEVGYRGVQAGTHRPGMFAIRSIFVMKKCYYDKLFCINNKTNKYSLVEHKRVKGITAQFMNEDRYERLLKGESMECDLCEYKSMVLRKTKQGNLVNLSSFKRVISKVD